MSDSPSKADDDEWLKRLLEQARARKPQNGEVGFTLDEASLMVAIQLGRSPDWEARLRDYMDAAVQAGQLKLRDAVTGVLLPEHLQVADDWGRITRDDMNAWLDSQRVDYRWEGEQDAPFEGADLSLLATRDRLVSAFGSFTGMDMTWFKNLNDTPALLRARKVNGTGGRGHTTEPWFCPFEVMQWLADSKRKKGRAMSAVTGWRMLRTHFPSVYARHEGEAPEQD